MNFIYNFLSIFLSLIVFYFIKNYWPKYFETKATNQATKEDIGEITGIVENIKSDLTQQNELLKAQISFKNQHNLNLKSAEREALFDFNRRISAWIYSLIRFSLSSYNIQNYENLKIASADFTKRQYEYDLAEAHLALFVHDREFLELKGNLVIYIITLEEVVQKSILNIYHTYSKFDLKLKAREGDVVAQSEINNLLYADLTSLSDAHRKGILDSYKSIIDLEYQLTSLIYKRLKDLGDS